MMHYNRVFVSDVDFLLGVTSMHDFINEQNYSFDEC